MKKTNDKIELRSKKVRKLIGGIPTILVRWGIAIMSIIVLLLLLALFYAPYPYDRGRTMFEYFFR